jgi:phosphatidylinositol alpha-1,6-mannosyltransferase
MNTMIAPMETNPDVAVKNRVLFLTLRTFSDTGGIQKVSRTICKTLTDLNKENFEMQVLSLCDKNEDIDLRYVEASNFKGFGYHRFAFAKEALKQGFYATTLLLSHVNLIVVAMMIKLIRPKIKVILLAHGIEVWKKLPLWKTIFMRNSLRIWSVSNFTAAQITKTHFLDPLKVTVLHNCLDPFFNIPISLNKPVPLLCEYHLTRSQPILLGISRMTEHEQQKGYDQVIAILPALLKEFPDLCYLLAGKADKEEAGRLTKTIAKKNLQKHVKLLGFIAESSLADHYLLADVFIMTSSKEGFGLVFIEAAACGRKIICGRQDGSREAILNGKLGKMVNPENLVELQETIRHVLRSKRSALNMKGTQQTCIKHFSYAQYQQKVTQLLHQH